MIKILILLLIIFILFSRREFFTNKNKDDKIGCNNKLKLSNNSEAIFFNENIKNDILQLNLHSL